MTIHPDVQFNKEIDTNPWEKLKQFTDARIALGRAGASIPTKSHLAFQLAHAQAKDAVMKEMELEECAQQLKLKQDILMIQSCATDKDTYLKHPDLGRKLSEDSRKMLQDYQQQHAQPYDVLIVAGDGLSARAIETNAILFIHALVDECKQKAWTVAPIVFAKGSRVALGDEVAEILKAKMLVMLIGERPGLSSPDSMGIYFTYDAKTGCHDAMRNCISNIRPAGLSINVAIQRLMHLMTASLAVGYSGVDLKDDHEMVLEDKPQQQISIF